MLEFFTKKSDAALDRGSKLQQYHPVSERTDDELIRFLNTVFSEKRPIVSSLVLVALEEFPARYCIFQRNMRKQRQYAASLDGMIAYSYALHQNQAADLNSEITSRKWYFLYIAGLLTIAQERAETNTLLWLPIAKIWLQLLDAAKDLRTTLSSTSIWNPDEIFFFNIIEENNEDILTFVVSGLLPDKLRFHPLLLAWKQRNLPRNPPAFTSNSSCALT